MADMTFQADAADQFHGPPTALLHVRDMHQGQFDIFQNSETVNDVIFLKYKADVLFSVFLPVGLRVVRGLLALDIKFTLFIGIHAADHIQQGRFT